MEIKELELKFKQLNQRLRDERAKIYNRKNMTPEEKQIILFAIDELCKQRAIVKAELSEKRSKARYETQKQAQKQKYVPHHLCNDYTISDDVAVFTTAQKKPVKFIVDVKDVDIVLKKRWHAHKCSRGDVYIVNRTYEDGKWKMESLLHALGYNRNYTFVNGNKFDFRRSNICMKKYIVEKYVAKTTNEDTEGEV